MTKFTYSELPEVKNEDQPVLYNINIGNKFYTHKGKKLEESLNRFLEDVFRGMRGKSCPQHYSKVVEYCNKYPAINKVSVTLIANNSPEKILKSELHGLRVNKDNEESLNRADLEPYKPEWMVKQALQQRCASCVHEGVVNGKKMKFTFCPVCGRLNK